MPLRVGDTAPEFELTDAEGRSYGLERFAGRKLLVFYKTTCPTCKLTLPFVEKLHSFYGQSLHIWGVVQDPAQEVVKFAKNYALTFPQLVDYPDYRVSEEYKVERVPTLYLIDEDRRVSFVSQSFVKADLERLNGLLAFFAGVAPKDLFAGQAVPELKPG